MKFFKPEDFTTVYGYDFQIDPYTAKVLSDMANARLELGGKVVYSRGTTTWHDCDKRSHHITKALLINTEPIEECKHEPNRIRLSYIPDGGRYSCVSHYECSCGKRVTPSVFKEEK